VATKWVFFKMRFGLKDTVINQMQAIFAKYESVEEVVLYGSRAKGNHKPASDIDLTIKGKDLNLSVLYKIENELDDLLLPFTIDLSLFQQLSNSDLVDHIQRVGKVFYQK